MAGALILKGWKVVLNLFLIQAKSAGGSACILIQTCFDFKDMENFTTEL